MFCSGYKRKLGKRLMSKEARNPKLSVSSHTIDCSLGQPVYLEAAALKPADAICYRRGGNSNSWGEHGYLATDTSRAKKAGHMTRRMLKKTEWSEWHTTTKAGRPLPLLDSDYHNDYHCRGHDVPHQSTAWGDRPRAPRCLRPPGHDAAKTSRQRSKRRGLTLCHVNSFVC